MKVESKIQKVKMIFYRKKVLYLSKNYGAI